MFAFYSISAFIILTAIFAYLNKKLLRLPNTIGLMLLSTIFSLVLVSTYRLCPELLSPILSEIEGIDFSKIVLDVLLCFLLFAGAMHTDYNQMRHNRKSIVLFSFVGVILSTILAGTAVYYLSNWFGLPINYLYALLFGALISPTDPIAVLGILTKANVPKTAEINIVGESLFNDGVGVVVFISLLSIIDGGLENFHASDVAVLFLREAGGGVLFGLLMGYIIFILLKSIDDYETEVIITLAAVLAGNWLAHILHVSGPLAMVVAGLMTGHKSKKEAMSDTTRLYVDKFWHLVDVLMNAILFVLIGLKILSIHFNWLFLFLAIAMIPLLLACRYLALIIPFSLSRPWLHISKKTIQLMTWGGLRGGLSIAMALSLPHHLPVKDELVFLTYLTVFFSIFVQGLTVERFARKIFKPKG
ncbi:MAG TPA: sodium:proton antiporter [Sediminibacterium sp.]|nr:sodium:proton antiporter [Sediminibacterium sp.]